LDYRKLNATITKSKFPMPIIDEFLDEIAGATYFTKLYLSSGFHQIRMAEGDEFKTAFKTHHGHF
jgi:ABC-type transporter MlaC component